MSVTVFSVLTSFLWFHVFILVLCFVRWRLGIVLGYSLFPLILAVVLSLVRLLLPFEPSFVIELRSDHIIPFILDVAQRKIFTIGTVDITMIMGTVCVCSLVSVVLLSRLAFYLCKKLRKLKVCLQTEDARLLSIFERVREEAPSRRPCYLYVFGNHASPRIFGLTYSAILLPEDALAFSDQDLYYILKHEWNHHLKQDFPVKLLIEVFCCILWWDPFVYLLQHNLNQTLELRCDANVLKDLTVEERDCYAHALLGAMRCCAEKKDNHSKERDFLPVSFLGVSVNCKRIASFDINLRFNAMEQTQERRKKDVGIRCCVCLILLFLFSFCFVIQPCYAPSEEDFLEGTTSMDSVEFFAITPETARLVKNKNGMYSLLVDGEYLIDIPEESIGQEPFKLLPITTHTAGP